MVESTALEMRHTRKGIGGSNPSLSAIISPTAYLFRCLPDTISYRQVLEQPRHRLGAGVVNA